MEQFCEKLKKLRESKSMSQAELAQKLYVSRSAVAKWEQGRGFPSVDSLRLIADLFDITVDELISDKELQYIKNKSNEHVFDKRKLYVCLSVFMCVIICISVTLTVMYSPRKLAHFIKIQPQEITNIFVEQLKENGGYENYDIINLEESNYVSFLEELKNLKYYPTYNPLKLAPQCTVYIQTKNSTYIISDMGLSVRNSEDNKTTSVHARRRINGLDKLLYSYNLHF